MGTTSATASSRGDRGNSIPRDNPDLTGYTFHSYTLVRPIGAGAMGVVYEATKSGRRLRFAIKILDPRESSHEAQALERIDHPNVVTVFAFGTMRDPKGQPRPYIVMSLVDQARSLATAAAAKSVDERLEMFEQVCRGVEEIHNTVNHHDLKPANILVGRHGVPMVTDFGLATPIASNETRRSGGTPLYMSPEQFCTPIANLTRRSDVYALGVILYELLTGTWPHLIPDGASRDELAAIRARPVTPPSRVCHELDDELDRIVLRALSFSPDARYEKASDLELAIARYRAKGVGTFERMRRSGARAWRDTRGLRVGVRTAAMVGMAVALAMLVAIGPVRRSVNWEARVPVAAPGGGTLTGVRIVKMPSSLEMVRLAGANGIPAASVNDAGSWRGLHGILCERLAGIADVIVFDIWFAGERPEDDRFAAGIRHALASETPVVVGAQTGEVDAEGMPVVSSVLWDAGVRWGFVKVDHLGRGATGVPLLIEREPAAVPSLSLTAIAMSGVRRGFPEFGLDQEGEILIEYWAEGRSRRPGTRRRLNENLLVQPTTVEVPPRRNLSDSFVKPGERVAAVRIDGISPEVQAASTVDYEAVLDRNPDALAALSGKIVVVYDHERDNLFSVKGRQMKGAFVHAAAIEALLANAAPRRWAGPEHLPAMVAAAALGVGLGWGSVMVVSGLGLRKPAVLYAASLSVRVIVDAGAVWALHAAALALLRRDNILMSPVPSACTIVLAAEIGAVWTVLFLSRHTRRRITPCLE